MIVKDFGSEIAFTRALVAGDIPLKHVMTISAATVELGLTKQAVGHALHYGALDGWSAGHRRYVDARSLREYKVGVRQRKGLLQA